MAIIPMLYGEWWNNSMENSFRSSRIISKPIDCDPFPGGLLLMIDDTPPRRCARKSNRRLSRCPKHVDKEQVSPKKVPAEFQINVDVGQFKPEDISVKATDTVVIVEAKHEEKDVENGYALRHFVRRYRLPEGHDGEKITSTLSSDGLLTIIASKKALALPEAQKERTISVTQPEKSDQNEAMNEDSSIKNYTLEDLNE